MRHTEATDRSNRKPIVIQKSTNTGCLLLIHCWPETPPQYFLEEPHLVTKLRPNQVLGVPSDRPLPPSLFDDFYVKISDGQGVTTVELRGRLRGGSKLPVLDEALRGVKSLGDLMSGNPKKAADHWKSYGKDSYLGNTFKAVEKEV